MRNHFTIAVDLPDHVADYLRNNYPKEYKSYSSFLYQTFNELILNNPNISKYNSKFAELENSDDIKRNNFSFYLDKSLKNDLITISKKNFRTTRKQATAYLYYIYMNLLNNNF